MLGAMRRTDEGLAEDLDDWPTGDELQGDDVEIQRTADGQGGENGDRVRGPEQALTGGPVEETGIGGQ